MEINYYGHQETIAQNLILLMRQKGCSRLSLSKLTGVPRPAIDQLLLSGGEIIKESSYNTYILWINQTFNLAEDYFLKEKSMPKFLPQPPLIKYERSELAQELLDGLDQILDIYSMYIK
ncbi:hypothetical protein JJQ72_16845 [Paenibacillus sp. F411]|uniref:hypothetical protein n=1 Tax=Paenibacillus sp. F411 TaxID=2820239 RepID=UPI001AAF89B2|nr:hypothetical protein [Paenibacillus sp. F411]MBO2945648.1 hypothetical protein [Paenibacillus sp. F411]